MMYGAASSVDGPLLVLYERTDDAVHDGALESLSSSLALSWWSVPRTERVMLRIDREIVRLPSFVHDVPERDEAADEVPERPTPTSPVRGPMRDKTSQQAFKCKTGQTELTPST